jgi:hypothetical protein
MTISATVPEATKSEDIDEIEIIEDVNAAAEEAIGLKCGDDNPYAA